MMNETPDQFEARLTRLDTALRSGTFFVPVMNAVDSEFKRRLFTEGLGADEQPLGVYSTRPIAIPKAFWPRKSAFRAIVKGGYRQFRILNGRQGEYVDLYLTGELFRSIQPTAISMTRGTLYVSPSQDYKLRKLRKKYPTAFEPGPRESAAARRAIELELRAILL
jgi:hypothetical protein